MRTLSKTFTTLVATGSLLFGNVTASLALDKVLEGPIEEAVPLMPVGPEFQVNTYTADTQVYPALVMDDAGNFVVAWESSAELSNGQDGDWSGIFAQRYDHTGTPLGVEFQVNTVTTGGQEHPAVAMDSDGNFVIVWESLDDETSLGIFGQRYNQFGIPVGSEFQVNTFTDDWQGYPSVAMNSDGKFVVVWHSWYQDGSSRGVFGQRYNHTGTPQGPEFQINTYTSGHQDHPRVAMDDDGAFVVVWESDGQDGSGASIYGQRYDHTGTSEGPEFQVNTTTTNYQSWPLVAMDSDGNVIVVWTSDNNPGPGDDYTVFGQRYDFTGAPVGPEFQIATGPDVYGWSVAMDDDRNAWVAFRNNDQDQRGVFVRGYDPSGTLIGSEFQVNTFTNDQQVYPAIALNQSGHATVAWSSFGQDGDSHGVFAQRYTTNRAPNCDEAIPLPPALFSNDHAYKIIQIQDVSDDDGDPVTLTVNEIYQDEAVNAAGSGFTSPDGKGIGTNAAEVRDEHVVQSNGRTYRINFTAEDELGASCSGMVFVRANPKSKFDWDWVIYDSTDTPAIGGKLVNPRLPSTNNPTTKVTP